MTRSVYSKALWDHRRALIAWVIGVAGNAILYAAFYPWMKTPAMAEAMAAYPEVVLQAFGWTDVVSPEGYLDSTIFGLLGPLLLIIYALAAGSAAIAGDEEKGALELLIAHPVSRSSLLWQRAAAMATGLATLGVATWASLIAISGPAELGIGAGKLAAATLQMVLLAVSFGALTLALGAALGRRGGVIGIAAAIAVASYLANNLATLVDGLAWLQRLSLFAYLQGAEVLRHGLHLGHTGLLLAVTAVLLLIAVAAFNRRDVAV